MSESIYKVTLPFNFLAEQRIRGGITVPREGGYEGPLTAKQLKLIEADEVFTVEAVVETPAVKPPTIKEKIEAAEAEGLTIDATGLKTHAEIDAAIEAARSARD